MGTQLATVVGVVLAELEVGHNHKASTAIRITGINSESSSKNGEITIARSQGKVADCTSVPWVSSLAPSMPTLKSIWRFEPTRFRFASFISRVLRACPEDQGLSGEG
jgi:hypothetical protein